MAQHLASGKAPCRRQLGFSYLLVLLLVVLMGIGLGMAGTLWRTESQRLKESDLLFIGEQYRKAIRSYYTLPGKARQYPKNLEDLLIDSRETVVTRHLRKLYPDPLTGKNEWGLIQDAGSQRISGVYSLAPGQPLKQKGFDARQQDFENAQSYEAWRFVVVDTAPAPPVDAQIPSRNPPDPNADANVDVDVNADTNAAPN